jgi:hypothetical protein
MDGLTCSSEAVFPKNVSPPVNSTVASTSPFTTVDPIFTESFAYIVTGKLSPILRRDRYKNKPINALVLYFSLYSLAH